MGSSYSSQFDGDQQCGPAPLIQSVDEFRAALAAALQEGSVSGGAATDQLSEFELVDNAGQMQSLYHGSEQGVSGGLAEFAYENVGAVEQIAYGSNNAAMLNSGTGGLPINGAATTNMASFSNPPNVSPTTGAFQFSVRGGGVAGEAQFGLAIDDGGSAYSVPYVPGPIGAMGNGLAASAPMGTAASNLGSYGGNVNDSLGDFGAPFNVGNVALGAGATGGDCGLAHGGNINDDISGGVSFGNKYNDAASYGDGVFTKDKELLIRNIAHSVFSSLKMGKAGNARTSPIENVVKGLASAIPSAKTMSSSSFGRNSKKQVEVCDTLARAVNKAYGNKLINLSDPPQERCRRVAEVLRTLLTGLNSEFMGVATSVARTIRNLRTLLAMIDASYDRQVGLVKKANYKELTNVSASVKEFHDKLRTELQRQITLLSNMLNVSIGETGRSLVNMLESSEDFTALIDEIGEEPGTPGFAERVAFMLSGANTVAQAAAKVKRALKRIGMSLKDFKKLRDDGTTAMRVGLLQHAIKDSKNDPIAFDKRMRAIATLKRLGPDTKIINAIKGGGYGGKFGADDIDRLVHGNLTGAAEANLRKLGGEQMRANNVFGGVDLNSFVDQTAAKIKAKVNATLGAGNHIASSYGGSHGDSGTSYASYSHGNDNNGNVVDSHVGGDHQRGHGTAHGGVDPSFAIDGNSYLSSLAAEDDSKRDRYFGHWDRKSIAHRVARQEKYRAEILRDFRHFVKEYFRVIVQSAEGISDGIKTGAIPINDDLRIFVKLFRDVRDFNQENLHIALSGYPRDNRSKEVRTQFITQYQQVLEAIVPLVKGPGGRAFTGLQTSIKAMIRSLDDFKDKMGKILSQLTLSRPEDQLEFVRDAGRLIFGAAPLGDFASGPAHGMSGGIMYNPGINSGSLGGGQDFSGVSDFGAAGRSFGAGEGAPEDSNTSDAHFGSMSPPVSVGSSLGGSGSQQRTYVELERVKGEMDYYISIANIKRNLRVRASETDNFAKDYDRILGEEAGFLINTITAEFGALINHTDCTDAKCRDSAGSNPESVIMFNKFKAYSDTGAAAEVKLAHDQLVRLWKRQLRAKIKMINVAQAVDLYLKSFTAAIAKDPDSITDIVRMLDSVEMVAKWYTDKSGDTLATVLECFPSGVDASGAALYSKLGGKKVLSDDGAIHRVSPDSHYYEQLSAAWGKNNLPGNPSIGIPMGDTHGAQKQDSLYRLTHEAVNSVRALENILSAFKSVGERFGSKRPAEDTFMNPGQIYNALVEYITMSAFSHEFMPTTDAIGLSAAGRLDVSDTCTYGGTAADIPSANPLFYRSNEMPVQEVVRRANAKEPGAKPPGEVYGPRCGVFNGIEAAPDGAFRKIASLALCGLPDTSAAGKYWKYHDQDKRDDARTSLNGWRDTFFDTDLMFQMVIKSIVAKVFVVVDAYRLFNCPTTDRSTHDSLASIRTILGGAAAHPKVIPQALELYMRLPLLAEWYRDKYGFNHLADEHAANADKWTLSLVPSLSGIWHDFIQLIFDKTEYITDGNYSEYQVGKIVSTINGVYEAYRTKSKGKFSTRDVINAFVVEINRVFGFLKGSEIKQYLEQRRKFMHSTNSTTDYTSTRDDTTHYDILNAEEQYSQVSAPSDKYIVDAEVPNAALKLGNRERVYLLDVVEKIRKDMDFDFRRVTAAGKHTQFSFVNTLRNYRNELAAAKESDRYRIISGMIQGNTRLVSVNANLLIMLHEAVAAPLAVLYHTYTIMSKLNSLLHGASLHHLEKFFAVGASGEEQKMGWGAGNVQLGDPIRRAYMRFLNHEKSGYVTADSRAGMLTQFSHALLSNNYISDSNGDGLKNRLNSARLARDLIGGIVGLCSNPASMIHCTTSRGDRLHLDFSQLEDSCVALLHQVKANIERMRINFDSAQLTKYEKVSSVGSTRWLEENLIQVIFKSRDKSGLQHATTNHLQTTMKLLGDPAKTQSIASGMNELIYYGAGCAAFNTAGSVIRNDISSFPFSVMALQVDISAQTRVTKGILNKMRSGGVLKDAEEVAAVNSTLAVPTMIKLPASWTLAGQDHSLFLAFNRILQRYLADGYDENTQKMYKPLFENFMNGPAREVSQRAGFPDIANHPAFDAGGVAANTAPILVPIFAGGQMQAPDIRSVVFASSAATMLGVVSNMDSQSNMPRHAFESLNDVPDHIRDRMKCNLPYYKTLLGNLSSRVDLLRRIVTNTGLGKNLQSAANPGAAVLSGLVQTAYASRTMKAMSGQSSANTLAYYSQLLSRLFNLTNGLRKCADNVYGELRDNNPFFMNTSKSFIADYKQHYGVAPLMPASHALLPQVACNGKPGDWDGTDTQLNDTESMVLFPNSSAGSNVFKYNYAARLVLGNSNARVTMAHLPGAVDIYREYAATAEKRGVLSESDYSGTIAKMFSLLRFNAISAAYGRLYSHRKQNAAGAVALGPAYVTASPETGVVHVRDYLRSVSRADGGTGDPDAMRQLAGSVENDLVIPLLQLTALNTAESLSTADAGWVSSDRLPVEVYSQWNGLGACIQLLENTNKKTAKAEFAAMMQASGSDQPTDTRQNMRIYNILDMGIVPINVHAFMREIPFVNLLNYSYTFDCLVHEFVLPKYLTKMFAKEKDAGKQREQMMISADADVASTREVLVKMLCHPYADLTSTAANVSQYYALLGSLFNGNDDFKLGIPQFLSDQLWHKLLLTSSAQIVAGQVESKTYAHPNNAALGSYPSNLPSLASSPAAFEAVRSAIRYSGIGANVHDITETSDISDFLTSQTGAKVLTDHLVVIINRTKLGSTNELRILAKALFQGTPSIGDLRGATFDTADSSTWKAFMNTLISDLKPDVAASANIHACVVALSVDQAMYTKNTSPACDNEPMGILFVDTLRNPAFTANGNISLANLGAFKSLVNGPAAAATAWALAIDNYAVDNATPIELRLAMLIGLSRKGFLNSFVASLVNQRTINPIHERLRAAVCPGGDFTQGFTSDAAFGTLRWACSAAPAAFYYEMGHLANLMTVTSADVNSPGGRWTSSDARKKTLLISSDPVSTAGLKFFDRTQKRWTVPKNQINPATMLYLAELGKVRFDTKLLRTMAWLPLMQRMMRVVMIEQLAGIESPVISGITISDPAVTEYRGNEQFNSKRFSELPTAFQMP